MNSFLRFRLCMIFGWEIACAIIKTRTSKIEPEMESRKLLLDFFLMVYLARIFSAFFLCMILLGNYPGPPPSSKKENVTKNAIVTQTQSILTKLGWNGRAILGVTLSFCFVPQRRTLIAEVPPVSRPRFCLPRFFSCWLLQLLV